MIILADKNGNYDGPAHALFEKVKSKYPIVLVSWVDGYEFNDKLLSIKDYILVCYCEYGWNFKITESHIWGKNTYLFKDRFVSDEWNKFDEWVSKNSPLFQFKRELLKKDVSEKIKPTEYPCGLDIYPMQQRQAFEQRPFSVFSYWGRSNECRIRIQGEIWLHAFKKGFQPCDNIYFLAEYLKREQGEKWVTLWMPDWARVEMKSIIDINGLSKLSLSWPGAGFKCFRTCESPVNSVLVQHKNDFAWAYDWDESNCILVEPEKEIDGIEAALSNENLYEIYKNGMQTVDKYRTENYINNYLQPLIDNL